MGGLHRVLEVSQSDPVARVGGWVAASKAQSGRLVGNEAVGWGAPIRRTCAEWELPGVWSRAVPRPDLTCRGSLWLLCRRGLNRSKSGSSEISGGNTETDM